MLNRSDLELAAQVSHAVGFQLEHADGFPAVHQLVRLLVGQCDLLDVELDAFGALEGTQSTRALRFRVVRPVWSPPPCV